MAIVLYSSGFISDKLIERKYSFTLVRKIFCSSGLILQSIFMFMMVIDGSAKALIAFVTLAIGLGGMAWSSFGVNHLDIGAGYANVLMAYSNTFATIPGILSPIITGHLIEHKTKEEWNAVFCISAAIYLVGAIIYAIIGSGETQKWAISSSKDIETNNATGFSTITQYNTVTNTVQNFTDNSAFALNEKSETSNNQDDEANKNNTA
jgi:ACS family sodium-dependent inorganic phosphate cotransporter